MGIFRKEMTIEALEEKLLDGVKIPEALEKSDRILLATITPALKLNNEDCLHLDPQALTSRRRNRP